MLSLVQVTESLLCMAFDAGSTKSPMVNTAFLAVSAFLDTNRSPGSVRSPSASRSKYSRSYPLEAGLSLSSSVLPATPSASVAVLATWALPDTSAFRAVCHRLAIVAGDGSATPPSETIARNAPLAVRETRRGVRELVGLGLAEAYVRQEEIGRPLRKSEDAREAQRAFVEKRKPVFRGR